MKQIRKIRKIKIILFLLNILRTIINMILSLIFIFILLYLTILFKRFLFGLITTWILIIGLICFIDYIKKKNKNKIIKILLR